MSLERQRRSNAGVRQHVDQGLSGESVSKASERLQVFDQVGFLRGCEIQREQLVIVIDDRQEIRRAPIMEIRRMLPESA